ncbi:tRNA ligase [Drechmeria coniospora]|uniref:tRNA ligase n=1 Tax=Drechmeria coniospora TaxID=98403 RepID=A0A151GFV3_DRECN|nr:tRNA ligase [Drechmeria coniospora]KYK55921.1 tRNA ligase [Drechmeria coniospora]
MATPIMPQNTQEVAQVLDVLEEARKEKKKGAFSVKKTTFIVKHSRRGIQVESWRLQDWDYKRPDLPTYARGFFTTKIPDKKPEIAIRGYDKFFNVGEVRETHWESISAMTQPPYELTLKENGCIIFISGLEDETLLVCSKHSTGDRSDVEISHARAGEDWLAKQLAMIGKTKGELASELHRRNATAVAELCDDSFEEHVLAYSPERAGLYLHGVNLNLPEFTTYPSSAVQEFADQWGFHKTGLIIMNDIGNVKAFLEEKAQSGAYDGRDVEGFVIRCKMSSSPGSTPYRDWFFKYKFEEPYLMYRLWRECTKALIAGRQPKFKKHVAITQEYLIYAQKRLASDPLLGQLYNQNHGIIGLRDDFLKFKNLNGADAASMGECSPVVMAEVARDLIICPVATIGCGKTTIALALTRLFGWGHVQNDDISGKGRPPRFTRAVLDQLKQYAAVFADRNNAQRHERKQIIADVKLQCRTVKLVCLNFRHDEEHINEIRKITQERVIARGDNHQTIHAESNRDKYIGVMEGFINRFEPCNTGVPPDDGFDVVINLNPTASSRANLETVVRQLHLYFPNVVKEVPSANELYAAMEVALAYKPNFHHSIPDRSNKKTGLPQQATLHTTQPRAKKRQLQYLAVDIPTATINALLEDTFQGSQTESSQFYNRLRQTRRVQEKFHVTLMHRAMSQKYPKLWTRYAHLHEAAGGGDEKLGQCELLLERVVFDDRVMAIVVRLIDSEHIWECANDVAHITVGTRDDFVKPKESNILLGKWLKGGVTEGSIGEWVFQNPPTIQGDVRGVL